MKRIDVSKIPGPPSCNHAREAIALRARVAKLEGLLVRVSERPGLTNTDRNDIRAALKGE